MTDAQRLCDGIAEAMLINLNDGHGADTMMLTHGLRDLANLCAEQQRQIDRLTLHTFGVPS